MRLAIIGSGYVGLVSGACFADFGHVVTCVDVDADKVGRLQRGEIPIYEPGLPELVARNTAEGRLHFVTDLAAAVAGADAVFLAVGTPSRRGDGYADLSYVYGAARDVANVARGFTTIVTKSTVPVGTADEVEKIVREARPELDFAVLSNPEFLREGAAINDFKHPDRIVVGGSDPRALAVIQEIYRPLYLNKTPFLFTDRRSAELIKYASNAFLATKITFINELADLCESIGADVQDVARGMGFDRRIGAKFLHAGPGFGGSCLPKDIRALLTTAHHAGSALSIVEATMRRNEDRKQAMAARIIAAAGDGSDRLVAILGLTFKPNTDDLREAPSLDIVSALLAAGIRVRAYDPMGMEEAGRKMPGLEFARDPYSCAQGADCVAIVTEWDQFRALDLARLASAMRHPRLLDLRNIYEPHEAERVGLAYAGIGRGHRPG